MRDVKNDYALNEQAVTSMIELGLNQLAAKAKNYELFTRRVGTDQLEVLVRNQLTDTTHIMTVSTVSTHGERPLQDVAH